MGDERVSFQRLMVRWEMAGLFRILNSGFLVVTGCLLLGGCSTVSTTEAPEAPSPPKSVQEALASFKLEPGLKIQLVASEPLVEDPVVISFDADGRLWVVEMRGFMPNLEGSGEREPVGRIGVLQDTDGDGVMDVRTTYLDSLVMPRSLAFADGGVLVAAREMLWMTRDLDGDLRADERFVVDSLYTDSKFPEHAANGLWRGIDNWYYNAKSRLRYRPVAGGWQRDSTEFRGQWGISHDDAGALYYNYNWSQLHADLVPPNYFSRNRNHTPTTGIDHGLTTDNRVYPIRPTPAVNRGYIPGTLSEQGSLREFTAACAPLVYRGRALPESFYGNVFVCEPSGNLIKRNVVTREGLALAAHDPHPGVEFLASEDERFRPVFLASGPDGALYVADMYRGLIQHGAYMTSYLREQTLQRQLVHPIHYGRIWKIVPEHWQAPAPTSLSDATVSQLTGYLSHADGWHRDMAQRLLAGRNDATAVKALTGLVRSGPNPLGRFHALWTLEAMDRLDAALLLPLLRDPDERLSAAALRLLEPFAAADRNVAAALEKLLIQSPPKSPAFALQAALTARVLGKAASIRVLTPLASRYDTSALMRDAVLSSLENNEYDFMTALLKTPSWRVQHPAREIFIEMLVSATVRKRDPSELKALLAMLDVPPASFSWRERAVLTGISVQGLAGRVAPVQLRTTPGVLQREIPDLTTTHLKGLAAVFHWPGAASDARERDSTVLNEAEKEQFVLGRKYYLNTCAGCHGNDGAGLARFAPPLRNSEWVEGDPMRLALILLHGIEGPLEVNGKLYDTPEILPVMPGHSTLEDKALAAILTYIRNEWGNSAPPVTPRTVGVTRLTSQGRIMPWSAKELDVYVSEKKSAGQ